MDSLLPVMFISLGLFLLFLLALVIAWLSGMVQASRIEQFLASDRPVIRWQYTPQEWHEIKEGVWREDRTDWRIQWGCLTFLFGLIGLLVGVLVGAEEGLLEAVSGGLVGAVLGSATGGVIGGAVGIGNYLATKYAYQRNQPGEVALAPDEFYVNDSYFKVGPKDANCRVELQTGSPSILKIGAQIYKPLLFREWDLEWSVVVPDRMLEQLSRKIPLLDNTD
ncbi:MAG: hypothetical protein JXA42_13175 [Anaerolineales bacterium]|nr:hypothetical protein [Anaerolineales bacterium]